MAEPTPSKRKEDNKEEGSKTKQRRGPDGEALPPAEEGAELEGMDLDNEQDEETTKDEKADETAERELIKQQLGEKLGEQDAGELWEKIDKLANTKAMQLRATERQRKKATPTTTAGELDLVGVQAAVTGLAKVLQGMAAKQQAQRSRG